MAKQTLTHDVTDWPKALRINVATIDLASAIYLAEREVYGGPGTFAELSPVTKAVYTDLAANLLQRLAPSNLLAFAVSLARLDAARGKANDETTGENGGAQ